MKPGDILTWTRTFTEEETLHFAEITGDKGRHHMERDEQGRLMVHGLLTASIGTKIGGDLHYIAREFNNEFLRPVFTGDTITCEVTIKEITPMEGFDKVALSFVYYNQAGKEVLIGTSHGIIRKEAE
ncbi:MULTISPECIES: MaoC/PaaZ C-terminal domain-containing protein [Brevibacillus]|uniref:Bifunctional enoyl-CoA hydratase/phosphate acetyltransferase n=1 Tax=Brevibacillus laterosporus LMG 15441 TaxID=1042163 RepID=A0A075R957_BRELA|nr:MULTISPECIES: MaoC/PaaZ C-terminal domain-containing protein [Brevibacillus]HAS01574.1 enoyl-CoA hydratase [Brevibacillus sp.]AIG27926.1 bifunctional enoyl-CoA hydratase/phosphate acetyltransferase [Brevibacillus laterosporus LMG 15441]AUM66185.1 enoyl-CoA hydratase [Brevibacillus laterosporus]AYK05130.1 enoyl-CoA hydratase [Brevibacillus laterosporus]ERM19061.1 enoyl-CoA hydratase [Brevibacillus laterosporus PE36]